MTPKIMKLALEASRPNLRDYNDPMGTRDVDSLLGDLLDRISAEIDEALLDDLLTQIKQMDRHNISWAITSLQNHLEETKDAKS